MSATLDKILIQPHAAVAMYSDKSRRYIYEDLTESVFKYLAYPCTPGNAENAYVIPVGQTEGSIEPVGGYIKYLDKVKEILNN